MERIQQEKKHQPLSPSNDEHERQNLPFMSTNIPFRRRRASLINSCHRRTNQTFFSKQLLFFLITITLFRSSGSGDQYSCSSNCSSPGNAFMLVSAATVAAAPTSDDDTIENKQNLNSNARINGVHAHPGGSPTPTLQAMKNIVRKSEPNMKRKAFTASASDLPNTDKNGFKMKPKLQTTATFSEILKKAGKSGIGGGIPGAIAGVIQVLTLMWLRTVVNYQCRYGASFSQTLKILYNEGGIPRFYRGMSFALVQAPLSRFVATAANDGVETLLANLTFTKDWGPGRSTVIASIVVGLWRMVLMPIDTCKTVLQVDSVEGFRNLMRKVKVGKVYVLYQGAFANAASAIFGHYPWFYTFKALSKSKTLQKVVKSDFLRNAGMGFVSSIVSDTFANSIRVVKTTKQAIASKHAVSYREVIAMILAADGWKGLFGRGLRTRILGNAVQSVLFTVIWRGLADRWSNKDLGENTTVRRRTEKEDDLLDLYDDKKKP